MHRVHGVTQHYAWGDLTTIPDLLGEEPDGRPCAELWFGTHPGGPSTIDDGEPLESIVGPLPYLLKVLSAAEPLSLQVHPSTEQAVAGFVRENGLGIPLDAPQRTYRDRRHKPELLYALTPFQAMCGVAPADGTNALLAELGPAAAHLRDRFRDGGVTSVVEYLLRERPTLGPLLDAAAHHDEPQCRWLNRLSQLHPGDPSAAMVLFLNHVAMEPGEAIYLGAGNLHAHLGGTGVEVMASSDNVVRCGLTSKYVDTEEVLRVLDPTPLADPLIKPTPTLDGGLNYPVPVNDFRITAYDIDGSVGWQAEGPELLLCTSGETVGFAKGQCLLATHGEEVELVGTATVFRIGVG
jgi:mannose-6-phosphate isomerase